VIDVVYFNIDNGDGNHSGADKAPAKLRDDHVTPGTKEKLTQLRSACVQLIVGNGNTIDDESWFPTRA